MSKKPYFELLRLDAVSRRARVRWNVVFIWLIVLFAANLVGVYLFIAEPPTGQAREQLGEPQSIVQVNSGAKTGTGFFVSSDHLLTAAHVAGAVGSEVTVVDRDGNQFQGRVVASGYDQWQQYVVAEGEVKDGATPYDWAAIKIDEPSDKITPLTCGSAADAVQGHRVFLAGNPRGEGIAISEGVVSLVEPQAIMTDGAVDPGYSGGPMIAVSGDQGIENGLVVGIIVSAPNGYKTLNTAVAIDVVRNSCSTLGIVF